MEFLFLIIGVLIGAIVLYVVIRPKLKTVQKLDTATQDQNEALRTELIELTKEHSSLQAKKEEILDNISILNQQAEATANALYSKSFELANEKMDQAAEKLSFNYKQLEESARKEYLQALAGFQDSIQKEISSKQNQLLEVETQLDELTNKLNAAVEANKRAEEVRTKQDFYRLQLSDIDIEEIKRLREVAPYLRDSEPLNKVIWKVYYEKPYTDLIGRVVGTGTHTGIYKITNIQNQMCYVGQAVNTGR